MHAKEPRSFEETRRMRYEYARDIRPRKVELRERYKQLRRDMPPETKAAWDARLTERVQRLWQWRQEVLLTYVSTAIEVDTRALMRLAWAQGKRVAVPRCVPGTRELEFYLIDGEDALSPGTFGVCEPDPARCERLTDMTRGLCLVPGLSYDRSGFRLGYGGGYYDRFLTGFGGDVAGICYQSCVARRLPHGQYDHPVDVLVTEGYIRTMHKERRLSGGHDHGGRHRSLD